MTTGLKLSRDEAVSALCAQAGYSKEEADAVVRQAKESRAEEKSELRRARIELNLLITANADLLKQVENLKAINTSLVQEMRSLKRTIKDLREQLKDLPEDSDEQQQGPKTKQQRLRKIPPVE